MSNEKAPRTCSTCAHRVGSFAWGRCVASGNYITTQRQFQTVCGKDFDAWQPRQGLFTRIAQVFIGCKATGEQP